MTIDAIIVNNREQQHNTPIKVSNAFTPKANWIIVKQGAEARIWKVPDFDHGNSNNNNNLCYDVATANSVVVAVCKERFAKKYRHPVLDARLIKQRCRMEARLLEKCTVKGIQVPKVYKVDTNFTDATSLIYMEWIEGKTVRDYLEEILLPLFETESISSTGSSSHDNYGIDTCKEQHNKSTTVLLLLHKLAAEMGRMVSQLHDNGIVHGDLTTSNMMLKDSMIESMMELSTLSVQRQEEQQLDIVLIDFGLAKNTTAVEERAVDLYVLERAIQSTHPTLPAIFLPTLLSAYCETSSTRQKARTETTSEDRTNSLSSKLSTTKSSGVNKQEILTRLEKVRQRGRKRECFG